MNFSDLKDYITTKMKMQHIYQPVMIKVLLQHGCKCSVRQIAQKFLELDESQIDYYKYITSQMPGRVLKKNGVVSQNNGEYSLNIDTLTASEKSELISLCDNKLHQFVSEKGGQRQLWLYRTKGPSYVPGPVRFEVLRRAKGLCELCGESKDKKALQVDHIIPRDKLGPSKMENYQALCYECNSQKGNRDRTDFRLLANLYSQREKNCPFCRQQTHVTMENNVAMAIPDKYPVVPGHTLIIPLRHTPSFFDLSSYEKKACFLLVDQIRDLILKQDKSVTGFNVGFNDGMDSGQTIFHCHLHVIPRRTGDVTDPRGGLRNIIPSKGTSIAYK